MLVLHILQGPDRGKKFELPADEPQLIGRSSESLPLTDGTVSRRHAELTPDDGRWFLRDLESANGTFVNGEKLDGNPLQLSPGDQIRCGSTLILFAIAPDSDRPSRIRMVGSTEMDVTIEQQLDPNEESMILAEPDPVKAAMDHLRVIYDLTALTATTIDRDELLNKVMDLIFDEFKPDRGFILLKNPNSDQVSLFEPAVIRYKVRPKNVDEGRIPVSQTIIQHTIKEGQGVLSTNAMSDTRFSAGDSVQAYGIRSALCVPIGAGEKVFGVISIDSSVANFTFSESQLRLLNAIGQHTSLALTNAQLVDSKLQSQRLVAIGQTVAWLSHSIKNILQGLRGGADAVELSINKGDLQLAQEGWPILSRNLDRIFNLTQNMLAYSKQRELDLDLTRINPLLEEAAELLQPQCDRKSVGLILDLAEDMPPIPIDANAMHQAVMNLLTNALDAAPPKRGVITLTTRFIEKTHEAQITVSDNGQGISKDRHIEVFLAFHSTKGQRGTGLGLAVTKKIVEEHSGKITIESQPNQGATFTITLPSDIAGLDSGDTRLPRPLPTSDLDADL